MTQDPKDVDALEQHVSEQVQRTAAGVDDWLARRRAAAKVNDLASGEQARRFQEEKLEAIKERNRRIREDLRGMVSEETLRKLLPTLPEDLL